MLRLKGSGDYSQQLRRSGVRFLTEGNQGVFDAMAGDHLQSRVGSMDTTLLRWPCHSSSVSPQDTLNLVTIIDGAVYLMASELSPAPATSTVGSPWVVTRTFDFRLQLRPVRQSQEQFGILAVPRHHHRCHPK